MGSSITDLDRIKDNTRKYDNLKGDFHGLEDQQAKSHRILSKLLAAMHCGELRGLTECEIKNIVEACLKEMTFDIPSPCFCVGVEPCDSFEGVAAPVESTEMQPQCFSEAEEPCTSFEGEAAPVGGEIQEPCFSQGEEGCDSFEGTPTDVDVGTAAAGG